MFFKKQNNKERNFPRYLQFQGEDTEFYPDRRSADDWALLYGQKAH